MEWNNELVKDVLHVGDEVEIFLMSNKKIYGYFTDVTEELMIITSKVMGNMFTENYILLEDIDLISKIFYIKTKNIEPIKKIKNDKKNN